MTRTVWRRPPHHEDTNHATQENAFPNTGSCRRFRPRNLCLATLGTCRGASLRWYRGTGLPRTGSRRTGASRGHSPAAGCRVPRARSCDPASGSVWLCAGCSRGILRLPLSTMETRPLPLAPLVMILSLDAALPCQADREGLLYLHSTAASLCSHANPVRQLCCITRGVVHDKHMYDPRGTSCAANGHPTMSLYCKEALAEDW